MEPPPLSGYKTKKTDAMAHLSMLQQIVDQKQVDWTGSFSQTIEYGRGFNPKWA